LLSEEDILVPDSLPEWAYWLLWCAAALGVAWVCLPKLLAVLGQTRCAIVIVGGPETLTPTDDDPDYADLFAWLHDLGFEPLGSKVEIGWFLPHHWHRRGLPGRIFATASRDCFASLYRLYRGDPWRVTFGTVFTDDSLVTTADKMANLRIEQEGYLRWSYPSRDLAEVLRQHYLAAEDYRAADGRTVDAPNLEEICETIRYHEERYIRRRSPDLVLKTLSNALTFLGAPALLLVWRFGLSSWTVPLGVVLGAALYTAFIPYAMRRGAKLLRERDQERELANQWARRREQARLDARDEPRLPASDAITPADRQAGREDRFKGGASSPR
jgi:hypothetical protein